MTYIVGWKLGSNVYMAADSMVTGANPHIEPTSSFGELHIEDGRNSVSERALKIALFDNLAVALAGDFERARGLVQTLSRCYRNSENLDSALEQMRISHSPATPGREASLLVGWTGGGATRLIAFNADGAQSIIEAPENSVVQIGSASEVHREITKGLLTHLRGVENKGHQAYIATILGFLQSYGIHDYLVPDGVGGAFVGLSITPTGIHWQPDLLFVTFNAKEESQHVVGTCIRENSLVICSTVADVNRIFRLDIDPADDVESWMSRMAAIAQSFIPDGRFDYVIMLDTARWGVSVFEMKGNETSRMLSFGRLNEDGNSRLVMINPAAVARMQKPMPGDDATSRYLRFDYFPHEAPD